MFAQLYGEARWRVKTRGEKRIASRGQWGSRIVGQGRFHRQQYIFLFLSVCTIYDEKRHTLHTSFCCCARNIKDKCCIAAIIIIVSTHLRDYVIIGCFDIIFSTILFFFALYADKLRNVIRPLIINDIVKYVAQSKALSVSFCEEASYFSSSRLSKISPLYFILHFVDDILI